MFRVIVFLIFSFADLLAGIERGQHAVDITFAKFDDALARLQEKFDDFGITVIREYQIVLFLCDDEGLETAPHPKCYPVPTGNIKCHTVDSEELKETTMICDTIESVANTSEDMLEMISRSNAYSAIIGGPIQTKVTYSPRSKSAKGREWEFIAATKMDTGTYGNGQIWNRTESLPKSGLLSFNPVDGNVRILENKQLFKFHEDMTTDGNFLENYYLAVEIDSGKSVLAFNKKVLNTPVAQQSYKAEL
ncbi:hypothetical protein Ddc_11185 [Ditylenchus destructor]|nr:hypothetical protein Ddc_11185 [Ditylenchus destructor]